MTAHREQAARRVLLIFLDGVGIGARDPRRNPFFAAEVPFLRSQFDGFIPSLRHPRSESRHAACVPANATLGVSGYPQSGTGQTALYTGVNAARLIGQHFGPYVYSTLKPVVAAHNIFQRLRDAGFPIADLALANAFPRRFFDYLNGGRKRMVAGMLSALSADVPFRDIRALKRGTAVSADITAALWKDIGHPDAPVLTPYEAGVNLGGISRRHAFTLFEYFLTDKAGHERSMPIALEILRQVDAFLHGVCSAVDRSSTLVIITSDHGNMEDLSTKTHTRNPVPVLFIGDAPEALRSVSSISDITPAVVTFLRGT